MGSFDWRDFRSFLVLNVILFGLYNLFSYITVSIIQNSFAVQIHQFFFPAIFYIYGLNPQTIFSLMALYVVLFFIFLWLRCNPLDEATGILTYIALIASVLLSIFLAESARNSLIHRDIWVGLFVSVIANAIAAEN